MGTNSLRSQYRSILAVVVALGLAGLLLGRPNATGASPPLDAQTVTATPTPTASTVLAYAYARQWGSFYEQVLHAPEGVAVDAAGNVYVVDNDNCVLKFDANGNHLLQWGGAGVGNGQFSNPVGIAVDNSGAVYVA